MRSAIITKAVGGSFVVEDPEQRFKSLAQARGIFRKKKMAPVPGDKVRLAPSGDPDLPWVIEKILPRKNYLVRPPMANLDVLLITLSRTDPAVDFKLIDKLLALAADRNVAPLLVLTKGDLDSGEGLLTILWNYWSTGFALYLTDEAAGSDPDFLASFHQSVLAFAGQSGVGKSSFLNRLFEEELMFEGSLSEKIQRGKQTTRHIELFGFGDGNFLADTPGFQSLDLERLELSFNAFETAWPEIRELAKGCRFHNCRHLEEPACAVKEHLLEKEDFVLPKTIKRGFLRELPCAPMPYLGRDRYERYAALRCEYEASLKNY